MTARDKLNIAITEFGDSEYLRGHEEGLAVALKMIETVACRGAYQVSVGDLIAELREIVKREEQRISRRYGK